MKKSMILAMSLVLIAGAIAEAQRPKGKGRNKQRSSQREDNPRRNRDGKSPKNQGIGDSNPQAIGDAGVAWYTTWDSGLAEAQRSNRPIFFMSAATTCSGVPGVF